MPFGSFFGDLLCAGVDAFLGVFFMPFSIFFAFGRHLGEAAFLKEVPSEILVFGGGGHPRNAPKVCPEGGPKMDLEKDTKITFLGFFFGIFFGLLGLPCGTLLLSCGLLAPGVQRGSPRAASGRPRAPQEPPRRGQERP